MFEATVTRPGVPRETVAVKTLDRVAAESEETVEAARVEMLEEARIMRDVSGHENIVGAVGVTIDLEHPMAAMEIVRGKPVRCCWGEG